jgi:hypothetical protein
MKIANALSKEFFVFLRASPEQLQNLFGQTVFRTEVEGKKKNTRLTSKERFPQVFCFGDFYYFVIYPGGKDDKFCDSSIG